MCVYEGVAYRMRVCVEDADAKLPVSRVPVYDIIWTPPFGHSTVCCWCAVRDWWRSTMSVCVCVFECVLYMCEFFTWAAYWNIGMNAFKFRLGRGDSEKRIDARVCCIEEQRWQLILFYICVWILIGLRYNRLHGIHAQFLKIHFRSSFRYTLRLEDDMIYFSIVIPVYRSIFWTRNHIRN